MTRPIPRLQRRLALVAAVALCASPTARAAPAAAIPLEEARIYFEYNQTDDDLGVHVFLDGEDWRQLRIEAPSGAVLFAVKGNGGYKEFGMTELFFEGAEPSLGEVPLADLLDRFPEGVYVFAGLTVDGESIGAEATLTHAIPNGPAVFAEVGPGDFVRIGWSMPSGPPPGFPSRPIVIDRFQVLVESFQVTLPASAASVTLPPEFVATLEDGVHEFEVLAIEEGGNQTITLSTFER